MQWTLKEGLQLVRALQPLTRQFGYHLTLGGSVLNKGESEKDLDLYFLPLDKPRIAKDNPDGLVHWLKALWGEPESIGESYEDPQENPIPPGPQARDRPQPIPVRQRAVEWVNENAVPQNPPVFQNMPLDVDPNQWAQPNGNIYFVNGGNPFVINDVAMPNASTILHTKQKSSYKFKLMFTRPGGDRIDVFVL